MSTVDFFVVVVMILSVLLSVLRGFTREVLTIVGFVGSAVAVIYGLPIVGPMFEGMFKDPTTAKIAAGLALGLGTLIVISVISHQIAKGINKVGLGMVDRTLGIAFGAARAALVLCLMYIGIRWVSGGVMPVWITEAKSTPYIAQGSDKLVSILPANIQADIQPGEEKIKKDELMKDAEQSSEKAGATANTGIQKAIGAIDAATPTVDKLSAPPAPPEKPAEPGYDKSEVDNLNRLLQQNLKAQPDAKH
jgi:membrane protein required for colicin V production